MATTTTTSHTTRSADVFDQLNDSFTKTFETGLKFQEETARFWTRMFEQSMEQGRDQYTRMMDAAAPFTRENTERFQRMFDEQAASSLKMLRNSFDINQTMKPGEAFDRLMQLWRSSFETFRESTESFAKLNSEMLQNWTRMMRQTAADGKPAQAHKPAGAK